MSYIVVGIRIAETGARVGYPNGSRRCNCRRGKVMRCQKGGKKECEEGIGIVYGMDVERWY